MNPTLYVGITVFVLLFCGFESPTGSYILLWPHHLCKFFSVDLLPLVDIIFVHGYVLLLE